MSYSDLLDSFENTVKLEDIATLKINKIAENEGGDIPVKGIKKITKYISEDDTKYIVNDKVILISRMGAVRSDRPQKRIAPSEAWMIVELENENIDEYLEFFNKEEFLERVETTRQGEAMPVSKINDLENIQVPEFR